MTERKRRQRLLPTDFDKEYGSAIRAGGVADLGWIPGNPLRAIRREHRAPSPIQWDRFEKVSMADLMARHCKPVPWYELRISWIAEQLRAAAHANEPESFKALLLEMLASIGVPVPDGVFTAWSKKLGAPKKEQTEAIHQRWIELNRPSLHKQALAKSFFRRDFTTVEPAARKKMVDVCRRAVERIERTSPTKVD